MTTSPVAHGSFILERSYETSPSQVFAAWADPDLKARWFIGPDDWMPVRRELDLRVGGQELLQGRFAKSGRETLFTARYHDIVKDERLVYVYDMHSAGKLHSTSLVTVEMRPRGAGTQLVFTEQVAFLDGTDGREGTASRERGTAAHLDRIGRALREVG
ncbi:MAG: ATPase [Gammaproteobacteria bacterium]|nr:MAG: ATPase [Gammaproteobacteria bacterium]